MGKARSDSELLLRAVTGKASRRLPKEILKSFEAALEGINIPKKPADKEPYLRAVTGIAHNLDIRNRAERVGRQMQLNDTSSVLTEFTLKDEILAAQGTASKFGKVLRLTQHSSKPLAYMQFLARRRFNISIFLDSAVLFANGRRVTFKAVPEKEKKIGDEILRLAREHSPEALRKLIKLLRDEMSEKPRKEKPNNATMLTESISNIAGLIWEDYGFVDFHYLLKTPFLLSKGILVVRGEPVQFHKHFKKGLLSGYVLSDPKVLHKYGMAGEMVGTSMLLDSGEDSKIQHELQHFFDRIVFVSGDKVDHEYRAYLAAFTFSYDISEFASRVLTPGQYFIVSSSPHMQAVTRIREGVKDLLNNRESYDKLSIRFRESLNAAYRKACGLTYDQILEPFGNQATPSQV